MTAGPRAMRRAAARSRVPSRPLPWAIAFFPLFFVGRLTAAQNFFAGEKQTPPLRAYRSAGLGRTVPSGRSGPAPCIPSPADRASRKATGGGMGARPGPGRGRPPATRPDLSSPGPGRGGRRRMLSPNLISAVRSHNRCCHLI